jgi:hypothetical protein
MTKEATLHTEKDSSIPFLIKRTPQSSYLIRNLWKMILFDKGPQYFSHTFNDLINHIIPEKSDHYMQVLSVVYARLSFSSYSFNKSEDSSLKRFINLSRNNLSDTTNGRVKLKFFLRSISFFSRNCNTWALPLEWSFSHSHNMNIHFSITIECQLLYKVP